MNVLAMVAHPDDEVLGAGGTLAKHAMNGDKVYIAYLTDGVGSRGNSNFTAEARRAAAEKAAECLGATVLIPHRLFPDNQMDSVPLLEVVHIVERYIELLLSKVIYTHHGGDLNIDHRICQQAVLTACRPVQGSSVKAIYAMEVPSSTEWADFKPTGFQPNRFVDVSSVMKLKLDALIAYKEETRPYPHPRSIEAVGALLRWRGACAGLYAVEAFMVLREIA